MELVALAKKVRGKYILTYRFIAYLGMGYIICEICVKIDTDSDYLPEYSIFVRFQEK